MTPTVRRSPVVPVQQAQDKRGLAAFPRKISAIYLVAFPPEADPPSVGTSAISLATYFQEEEADSRWHAAGTSPLIWKFLLRTPCSAPPVPCLSPRSPRVQPAMVRVPRRVP